MVVPHTIQHTHKARGDAGMIVASYTFGETKVHICDDHIAKSPEEREKVDTAIADAAWACLQDAADSMKDVSESTL
ncbi:hypothetical protein [Paenibacillus donghaensis]|uniref:Uncharacterized protein n=1 Tax=Paenibacillus donghaensis TaxID=414771 RepID=A0A2Z2K3V8_9BACL|nr:hypothetical protein [Paenibacillus donghaensis]ASA20236.1 hypothetical protein B9T62_05130 [Paenibacillus donghaensis]